MLMLARIRDAAKAAWRVLWGRSEVQLRMARIEREWVEIEIEFTAMFEKVNSLLARVAKRQRREDASEAAPELSTPPNPHLSKAELRRKVFARKLEARAPNERRHA